MGCVHTLQVPLSSYALVSAAHAHHLPPSPPPCLNLGDFNTVPERHLSGASIPRLCPDLLISESTYATSIREDRRSRERHLLKMVSKCGVGVGLSWRD